MAYRPGPYDLMRQAAMISRQQGPRPLGQILMQGPQASEMSQDDLPAPQLLTGASPATTAATGLPAAVEGPTAETAGTQPGFFNRLFTALNRPEAQAFLLNMGSTLLRPPQFGQTTAQQIGQGLISGYGGLSQLNAQRAAMQQQQTENQLKQREQARKERETTGEIGVKQTQVGINQQVAKDTKADKAVGREIDEAKLGQADQRNLIEQSRVNAEITRQQKQVEHWDKQLKLEEKKLKALTKQNADRAAIQRTQASAAALNAQSNKAKVELQMLKLAGGGAADPMVKLVGQETLRGINEMERDITVPKERKAALRQAALDAMPDALRRLRAMGGTASPEGPKAVPGGQVQKLADRYGIKLPK